jgi:cardiolipin synthase
VDDTLFPEEELVVARQSGGNPEPRVIDHTHDIYSVANIITVLRLILVPFFFAVLIGDKSDALAFVLFAVAASTDWIDGQIARRTGTVTELGQAIDPLVDRLLIASAVIGLYLEVRLPLWIVLFLVVRDLYLLGGAYTLAQRGLPRIEVVFVGKLTTALLLVGFGGLILNMPTVPGLGLIESPALPGWGSEPVALGMWFVYAGLVTSAITAAIYTAQARALLATSPKMPVNHPEGEGR